MTGYELSSSDWLGIIKHVKQWLGNLGRANQERRQQSKKALRAVLLASRKTECYVTDLNAGKQQSREKEEEISYLWATLEFELEDLCLTKLAKVCRIKGKYWATRKANGESAFTEDFLIKAGARLADVERLANLTLRTLK
jgi:hypothetical protein